MLPEIPPPNSNRMPDGTQLGAHKVSNLGGIDNADNVTGLVQPSVGGTHTR
jgi:hypothetical protein